MRIITFAAIRDFSEKHADAEFPLRNWYSKTKKADWSSLGDMKKDFNNVDYIGNDRYVFNIKGNKHRLVAIIIFTIKKVYIRFIGTHIEYDKIDCKTI